MIFVVFLVAQDFNYFLKNSKGFWSVLFIKVSYLATTRTTKLQELPPILDDKMEEGLKRRGWTKKFYIIIIKGVQKIIHKSLMKW